MTDVSIWLMVICISCICGVIAMAFSLHQYKKQLQNKNQDIQALKTQLLEQQEKSHKDSATIAQLETTLRLSQKHHEQEKAFLHTAREELKASFAQLSQTVLEKRSKALSQTTDQQISSLLTPLKAELSQFRERIEAVHSQDLRDRAGLKTELKHLHELNQKMSQEAHELATALKGQKKLQGIWGEQILTKLLENAGLKEGVDFTKETSLSDQDGAQKRPDIIIQLPGSKHLIIDAKVSLNSYTTYCNSDDPEHQSKALNLHIQALRQHIKTLSQKRYHSLPGLHSPELVLMFVPIESALALAYQQHPELLRESNELGIHITTPTTLLASMQIVANIWRLEQQNKKSRELAEKASRVHNKLRLFLNTMDQLGKQLDSAKASYTKAFDQLTLGRGNLVKQVEDFKKLGVGVSQELPEVFTNRADLEVLAQGTESTPQLDEAPAS